MTRVEAQALLDLLRDTTTDFEHQVSAIIYALIWLSRLAYTQDNQNPFPKLGPVIVAETRYRHWLAAEAVLDALGDADTPFLPENPSSSASSRTQD